MEPLRTEDPSWVGEYRLLGRLGAGGMGQVYLGRSTQGRMAAVKVIHPQLSHDTEFRRRFRAEVRAAQRVDGAFTAPVLAFDTESPTPWLATGYVPGVTLHEAAAPLGQRLPGTTVWWLAAGLAEALRNIHAVGLVHRDLKPSNVMLTLDGPRVIDFGVARAADASVATRTGAVIGSPGYMSPEQVRGKDVTALSDLFSLGSVLAFAATNRHPFGDSDSGSYALMMRVIEDPPDVEGVPEALAGLIHRCLAKDPAERPALDEIVAAAAGATDGEQRSTWLPPALSAEIGRRSARLLSLDGPQRTQLDGPPGGPNVHGNPTVQGGPGSQGGQAGPPGVHGLPTMHAPGHRTPPPRPPVPTPHPTPHPAAFRPPYPQPYAPRPQPYPTPQPYTTPYQPPYGRSRRRRWVLPSALGAVVLLALVAVLLKPEGDTARDPVADGNGTGTASSAPAPAGKPFAYRGRWSGMIDQSGSQDYSVKVDYTGGKTGRQVATVEYPSLGCGGHWILLDEDAEGQTVREKITHNSHCVDDVEISLTRSGSDRLLYEITGSITATGTLSRNN
ncbi:serine/threonine-protein kinase [Streptomyces sp. NPDC087420]|uniref:serine/threonine-protein kinase n=1 Tax=Streptomyces sp. NPDC087420 TaxID=3365785 RepID=UPI00383626E1